MKKCALLIVALVLTFTGHHVRMAQCGTIGPPPEGGTLSDVVLIVPKEPADRQYLGLQDKSSFRISEIQADVVIIEVFSMYCPYCQKEAPVVNRLYQLIANHADLKERIKMIGIGAGNSTYEVKIFKNRFNVPFPLFSDPDFSLYEALGDVRTPYFIGLKTNRGEPHEVIYSRAGSFGNPQVFLELIVTKSKLEEGR